MLKRLTQGAAAVGVLVAVWTVFAPAVWMPDHPQVLTNVLVGEFAALALAHTVYRMASGRPPFLSVALAAALFGALIAASPLVLGLVVGLTTSNMVSGTIIAVAGVAAAVVSRGDVDDRGRSIDAADEAVEAV